LFCAFCANSFAQTSSITYQGRLNVSGTPTSSPHDIEFRLCSSETGDCTTAPGLVGTDMHLNVTVTGGIFSVTLNFAAPNAFDGSDRWLLIGVKAAGSPGPYQSLLPRQPITSAPYSLKSLKADQATNATSATSAVNATNVSGGTVSGDGAGLTNLNAANIASGTLADARHSPNVALKNASNIFTAAQTVNGDLTQTGTTTSLTLANGFVTSGTLFSGSIPATGEGARMMFYPGKAAFRAGYTGPTEWSDANIGLFSTAMGQSTRASGTWSTALGQLTTASGDNSTAMGYLTTASGEHSTAMGRGTTASGLYSTAMGFDNIASGWYSTAMGGATTASGNNSTAMGTRASTNGLDGSFVYGDTTSGVVNASAANQWTIRAAGGYRFFTNTGLTDGVFFQPNGNVGLGTTSPTERLHVVGNGLLNGDLTQTGTTTTLTLANGFVTSGTAGSGSIPATGAGTRMMFYPGKAAFRAGHVTSSQWDEVNIGILSTAMGSNTTASGDFSTAMGSGTTAGGGNSTAMGGDTTASGDNSTAMGFSTTASGSASTAMGWDTTASGGLSTAMGYLTTASGIRSTAMGAYASTNGFLGSFVYGDSSTSGLVLASAANQWTIRAVGGYRFFTDSGLTDGVFFQPNGNVGLGTTLPTERLHVVGNGLFTGNLTVSGTISGTLPSGSTSYIQNQNAGAQASSNFNISGNGTAGGTLSGNVVNAATQYNIGGNRILSNPGTNNIFAGAGTGQLGNSNSFVGASAGQGTTGDANTFLGYGSGISNATGTNNTIIGYLANVGSGLTNATAIGNGASVNASNKVRLGNGAVTVIEGQVAYTFTSDKNSKENFLPVNGGDVLRKIRGFNMTSWNYKGQDPKQFRHYGPMAQDFYAAFGGDAYGTFGTPTTINSGDMSGIMLAAIKELSTENQSLKTQVSDQRSAISSQLAQIEAQQKQIEKQQAETERQKNEVAELKAVVCALKPDAKACLPR
jgi:hypothetical protein